MEFVHTQKFIRMSPEKLRIVAHAVKKLDPNRAVEILPYMDKRAALPLQKVLKTAIANAKNNGVGGELRIKHLEISEGPKLKRGRAASRGRWHPYKRRMSHIKIVLEVVENLKTNVSKNTQKSKKVTKKSETLNSKSKTKDKSQAPSSKDKKVKTGAKTRKGKEKKS